MNVLLIEDCDEVRAMLRASFEDRGFAVTEATDGREGMAMLDGTDFDIVVTDILMPTADGLEVLLHMRRTDRPAPVIAVSGDPLHLTNALGLGAAAVAQKPFLSAVAEQATRLVA